MYTLEQSQSAIFIRQPLLLANTKTNETGPRDQVFVDTATTLPTDGKNDEKF